MDFFAVLASILSLFVVIGLGFLARRHGLLDAGRVHTISHILVNIALPALTISSMQVPDTSQAMTMVDSTLAVAFAYYIGAFLVSLVVCHFLPATGTEKGVFRFMLVFPNVGFMGIPVAEVILGPGSLFYVILFNLPFNLLAFTLGVWLLAGEKAGRPDPRVLLTPGLAASILGLFLFLVGYHIPYPADATLDWIGKATTPLAMLVVGALLATLPSARLAGDWRVYLISAMRLLVFPLIAFAILSLFVTDRLLLLSSVLLIAMPVAANTVLLSEEYEVDATLASQGVFLSTLLCLATIPLLDFLFF
ncbi:AEC family transporter [Methanoregula sp.]|uniref:AEC family transporter n=1 Tax=Methanoregula sp. TaxID=2052170 RepID=UPI003C756A60